MKISIAIAYLNRKQQFYNTLYTVDKSKYQDKELIIVDDGSTVDNKLDDIVNQFNFKIKLIRIEPQAKFYVNPCVAYNIAFRFCTGDAIIIQNPECCYTSDIISQIPQLLNNNNYLSFACYAESQTQNFHNIDFKKLSYNEIYKEAIIATNDPPPKFYMWYNHSKHRPCAYHFMSCITKENLVKLGGFDEIYAMSSCYDDDDLVLRIKNMGLKINILDDLLCIHQHHERHIRPSHELNKSIFKKRLKLDEGIVMAEKPGILY